MNRYKVKHPVDSTFSDVDVNGTKNFSCNGTGKVEGEEETECSSSFENSDSGIENSGDDSEVASYVHHDSTSDLAIGFDNFLRMRRKKLTIQWKTFIQPLMWRCKWLELQIKKCNAQALKYDRELASYNARKQLFNDNFTEKGLCAKLSPFPSGTPRDKIMCRKKRRKIEDMEDIALYMSNHNVFSYEGKHSVVNGAHMDNDLGIPDKINGDHGLEAVDTLWLQSGDGGYFLFENTLHKLDSLQSKVNNLRKRMNKLTSENVEKLSLADDSDLLVASSNFLSSLVQSPNIVPELPTQIDYDGVGMARCSSSSTRLRGLVGSGDLSNLLPKGMKEEVINDIEEHKMQPVGSTQEALHSVLDEFDSVNEDQPGLKMRSIAKLTAPKSRKKRGKRMRGSSSRWSRRS